MATVLVIGIGNEYGRDDAVGLLVARALKSERGEGVEVLEQSGEGVALMEAWKGADFVIVIDAARSGDAPGTLHRFDASRESLPARSYRASTHAFGLYEAVEVARSLNQLPRRLIVYAIEGRDFTAGIGLSLELSTVITAAVAAATSEIEHAAGSGTG